ncbi:exodeoxyribonuclease VII small subunit [Garciella nitratireducens]|uniref:Exodeoxyribonuclease 7 small subunit n=1 Tax=Garciella nitratireducens DSM 15102 TaxID=1121911 RepID=A0A1T4K3Q6_9FIRM|nr:exodeoxyribonuclease VII small subunit [Garciella nitratireducens]RBP46654.1 exodeoxyribonuclease VII small subunit [Garciella nitratireducens]SJZ37048.1 Exodeoxyribonuclease VII small subunit [Garciella nitratireducens DSM 15102]
MSTKKKKNFEENLTRLEEIVSILEEGKISLEESIDLFEEGMKLTKVCNDELESIEQRIMIVIEENGDKKEEKFDINGVK